MFKEITHSRVFVNNQDEARDFYVEKLGLEVSADVDLEVMRWLTVKVPGSTHNVLLEQSDASFRDESSAEQIKELMSKGDACMFILETDDCHATFEDLKSKGVDIIEEPVDRFYGIDCAVRDPFGNHIRITEPKEVDLDEVSKANSDATEIIS